MSIKPTFLGYVSSVSGSSAIIDMAQSVESGIVVLGGRNYRVGQVGSFVKIVLGYNELYGIISESSESSKAGDDDGLNLDRRWLKVELAGEVVAGEFERGISEYPSIGSEVHLVVDTDLEKIFGDDGDKSFRIGTLSSSDGIEISLDLDKLVARHSAILGSTGSGKSTSTASILRSMVLAEETLSKPSARILLIDMHGEYKSALGDLAKVFSIMPEAEEKLYIPYWCLSPDSLINLVCGTVTESQKTNFTDKAVQEKIQAVKSNDIKGITESKITSLTPLPFNLRKIWYDLWFEDNVNWEDKEQTKPAFTENGEGSAEELIPPKFEPPGPGSSLPKKGGNNTMRKQLDLMKSRMIDAQYSFILQPGEWEPDENGVIKKDLDQLISTWLGHDKPITIFDLSGMPSSTLSMLLGAVLEILFEVAIWGRNHPEGMRNSPLLLVLEEAHRYLSKSEAGLSKHMVQRIAKEGRKFGVGAMIVSQRPSEIDETILSQCGTIIALRINNSTDRGIVKSAISEGLGGVVDTLPVLRTGEAVIIGEAAKLPTRCKIKLLPEGKYPNSSDPEISHQWSINKSKPTFGELIHNWRTQNIE